MSCLLNLNENAESALSRRLEHKSTSAPTRPSMISHSIIPAASDRSVLATHGNVSVSTKQFRLFRQTSLPWPEPPIRAELFSVERLEQHAESLAAAQHIAPNSKRGRPLVNRLYDNARVLTETYRAVVRAHSAHHPITPAAEWLLDNFHIVDEQIREIKGDLPPGFYRRLRRCCRNGYSGWVLTCRDGQT